MCQSLTAETDVDVAESDVDAKVGDNLLRREGPVGAGDLLLGRVPFRAVASNCPAKKKRIFISN